MKHGVRIPAFFFVLIGLLLFSFTANSNQLAKSSSSSDQLITNSSTEDVYEGPRLRINVPARELYLYDANDKLVKKYKIAVGRSIFPTPIGRRWMNVIVWNPWWIPPKSGWAENDKPTPPGPRNPLGPVKMKLNSAIMIHGTSKPSSIGRAASHGCMRMHSDQAKELARYIQKSMTELIDAELFEKYEDQSRRSFHVNLEQHVPVDIVYEVVEIKGNKLYVYQDIYYRVKDKAKLIVEKLIEKGYDPEDIDMDYVKSWVKKTNNADVSLNISKLIAMKHNQTLVEFAYQQ